MIKSFKYKLYPNNKQNTRMLEIAGATRFAYNWALSFAMEYFEQNHKFISVNNLTKEFTKYKKNNNWLYKFPSNSTKQAVKNAGQTVINVYMNNKEKHTNNKPCFKRKFKSTPTIYLDSCQVEFTNNFVKLDKISLSQKSNRTRINWVRLSNKHKIPTDLKTYITPTIKFDGFNWYITVSVEIEDVIPMGTPTEGIGIDLGIKDLAICSNGIIFPNINKTKKVKYLEKKYKKEQRKFSRQIETNKVNNKIYYSNNMVKQRQKLKKLASQLTHIRENYIYQSISNIINQKPQFISIEDLNIKGMLKNKHLSKLIQEQKLHFFRQVLTYKCSHYNIPLIIIDRWYPSSKECSNCHNIYKQLKLSDRIYNCPVCNLSVDRDFNASINIREKGRQLLQLNS